MQHKFFFFTLLYLPQNCRYHKSNECDVCMFFVIFVCACIYGYACMIIYAFTDISDVYIILYYIIYTATYMYMYMYMDMYIWGLVLCVCKRYWHYAAK